MSYVSTIFDYLIRPFEPLHPMWLIAVFSAVSSVIILFIFRHTSDQNGLRLIKNRLKAHLLEIVLYRNNFRVLMSAQKNLIICNMKYLLLTLKPIIIMILPVALCLAQLHDWLGYTPLPAGQSAVLKIKLADRKELPACDIRIRADRGIIVETPALRIAETGEINWRIKASACGRHRITIKAGGEQAVFYAVAGRDDLTRISALYAPPEFLNRLLYSEEKTSINNPCIKSIEISYPERSIHIWGMEAHWLTVFLIITLVLSYSVKGFFGIEI